VAAGSLDDSLIGLFASLSVLSSVISGCLDFRLLLANYMNVDISFKVVLEFSIKGPVSSSWKP